ncbi:RTA1 domain protein [Trichoderma guizhouense]|uniref:RTA1 domain protein n=1 Tax=Trichoderma guizhouense TaxID=1491466 RepID=A0A1T3CI58_9HYPO|nr:RTA1 domain protein [Trichoderma guizhouense]
MAQQGDGESTDMWQFSPSLGASILFLVLFFLTTAVHLGQAIYYKQKYCWVIIMSGIWQVLTYIFRTISIQQPDSFNYYAAWFVLILVAPLWTNAFVYMVFGRMVWNYTDDRRVWRVKAQHFGFVFVLLDIVSFVIQVYGAARATAKDAPTDKVLQGLHIYMAGVGIQQLFILIFCLFALRLLLRVRKESNEKAKLTKLSPAMLLLYTQFIILALISLRIIFRICEYAQGLDSTIPLHEAYQYALDSLPMLLALVAFNAVHPGRIMSDSKSDLPSFRMQENRTQIGSADAAQPIVLNSFRKDT